MVIVAGSCCKLKTELELLMVFVPSQRVKELLCARLRDVNAFPNCKCPSNL